MSEGADGELRSSRRTYLKGLAATGLATSLAGCIHETYEAFAYGLDADQAAAWEVESAHYRQEERIFKEDNSLIHHDERYPESWTYLSVTIVSNALTYNQPEDISSPFSFGSVSTPTPELMAGIVDMAEHNPLATTSMKDLMTLETARQMLRGFGITVPRVDWADGPTTSSKASEEYFGNDGTVLGVSDFTVHQLTGVLRDDDALRAVVVLPARLRLSDPSEVVIVGIAAEEKVESTSDAESFYQDRGSELEAILPQVLSQFKKIDDPKTELKSLL